MQRYYALAQNKCKLEEAAEFQYCARPSVPKPIKEK